MPVLQMQPSLDLTLTCACAVDATILSSTVLLNVSFELNADSPYVDCTPDENNALSQVRGHLFD